MKKTVVAIGEILWDVLPDQKKAGGSSMNMALNLHKQNINSKFISAIGDDKDGKELIDFLKKEQFPSDLIQVNDLPTSTVKVKLDEKQQATYTIVEPVAWDAIELSEEALEAVKNADALVYCSLTCRNEQSRNTILSLLKEATFKIFDINLRAPFYETTTLKTLLSYADVLKVNDEELLILKSAFELTGNDDEQLLKQLSQQFNIATICLTLGDKGAQILHEEKLYHHKGYHVKVADTVGAGDAFLATFVASYLNGFPMDTVLDRACKVGSYVASQHGANPPYGETIFE
ncbi:MAG: carbohydrate kinase [Pedobacter sp.]|nr:MAG: carbohydrate kinase [Pedobacter sp.]